MPGSLSGARMNIPVGIFEIIRRVSIEVLAGGKHISGTLTRLVIFVGHLTVTVGD